MEKKWFTYKFEVFSGQRAEDVYESTIKLFAQMGLLPGEFQITYLAAGRGEVFMAAYYSTVSAMDFLKSRS